MQYLVFLSYKEPPIVSYSYTKTIGPKIFNFKQCMKNLDFNVGTQDMSCNCKNSIYIHKDIGRVCFLFFQRVYVVLFIFPFSKQTSLSLIWGVTGGPGAGGGGAGGCFVWGHFF